LRSSLEIHPLQAIFVYSNVLRYGEGEMRSGRRSVITSLEKNYSLVFPPPK
jgi:hypothetical protein